MSELRSVGQVARELSIPPRILSDLFYSHHLDNNRCPVVGGRRLIPNDYLPELEEVLRERGILETEAV
ncbi:MAG: hypothetical protein KDA84_13365 [Planctomycetaceae bacterium]|nr:hypothetical protein [Planctomycetaceae bacterium]